jgi:hypothetical protein
MVKENNRALARVVRMVVLPVSSESGWWTNRAGSKVELLG